MADRPVPCVRVVALGIEGSANKVGVGVVVYEPGARGDGGAAAPSGGAAAAAAAGALSGSFGTGGRYTILANPRKTYVTPPGHGFLPKHTALHHQARRAALWLRAALAGPDPEAQAHVARLVRAAMLEAGITPSDVSVVCFTQVCACVWARARA